MSPATANRTLDQIPRWMTPLIRIVCDYPAPPSGAAFDADIEIDHRWYCAIGMEMVLYSTFHHVNGLLRYEKIALHQNHVDPQVYKYFFGYRCRECNEVYLVPDWVADESDLCRAMRHDCAGIKQQGGTKQ